MIETGTVANIRRILMGILVLGVIGTGTELLLLEHTEGFQQLVPVLVIALSLAVLVWHALAGREISLRALQWTMVVFVLSGVVGLVLHYQGNVEFELETYPSLAGMALFQKAMGGATPALAPGTMIELGLVGLAYTYRHPLIGRPEVD